ncbi:peroxygenase 2 [Striga asiatica]|uniref:Peroxygenase 2 n=1 Tax=Striga asiatica TaxID=4170 RepID=A0A5A7RCI9_STRAF|nr:peroxygenase 2 [Striga asiatica]
MNEPADHTHRLRLCGTPVSGSHCPPARKTPGVYLEASAVLRTLKWENCLSLRRVSEPGPLLAYSNTWQVLWLLAPSQSFHPSGRMRSPRSLCMITVSDSSVHGLPRYPVAPLAYLPPVGRHRVELPRHRPPHNNLAVLDHRLSLSENEVHGPVYPAVAVELPVRLVIECVLVPLEAAVEYGRLVPQRPERHRLVPFRPRHVFERHRSRHKPGGLVRKRGRVHRLSPLLPVVLASRHYRSVYAVPVHIQVHLTFVHYNLLVVDPGLHIDHEPPLVFRAGVGRHRLPDRLELPAPILGHNNIGPRRATVSSQKLAIGCRKPLGVPVGGEQPTTFRLNVEEC